MNSISRKYLLTCILTLIIGHTKFALADPWYTGPLLAPQGKTIPLGHFNFELYGFDTTRSFVFNNEGKKQRVPRLESLQANPILTYGLADWVDVQASIPYTKVESERISGSSIGDLGLTLGFQGHRQKPGSRIPDVRFTIMESFATGKFDGLNPTDKGITATGTGGYETVFGLNFQELTSFNDVHYLRTRLAFSYMIAQPRNANGVSAFGGAIDTQGTIDPGDQYTIDLAGEFSVTQNWVAVMELFYANRGETTFQGVTGHDSDGNLLPALGQANFRALSLAPAIEYNFSEHYGIIGGVWFAVEGKNTPVFTSGVVAFNVYW